MASPAPTPHAQPAPELDNRRTIAAAIDTGPFVVAAAALLGAGLLTPATGLVVLAWMAFYGFAFESGGDQTLGKRLLKLRVVDANGNPPTMRQAAIRNVLRIADLPLVGLLVMIASGDARQRLGDKAADTYVIDAGPAMAVAPDATTERLATLAPGHAAPVPESKPKRKSLGGPEIRLPKFGRKKQAPATAAPAPAPEPAAKPKRKTLGGPEIKLPKFGRRKQAETGPEVFTPDVPAAVSPSEPVAEVVPEPIVEAEPEVTPEPVAFAEPEITFDREPEVTIDAEPEPDVTIDPEPEPEITIDREPEVTIDAEPEPDVTIDREPQVTFDHEPEVTIEPEPDVTYDREPAVSFDREPDVSLDQDPVAPPPADPRDDPVIEVKPIETVSAIDLVMQDADDEHRPGA